MIKWPCNQTELDTLLYAAANTAIPVLKVPRTYECRGHLAIEMEYFRGSKNVQEPWHELSDQEKERAAEQVAGYFEQLQNLQLPDKKRVSGLHGRECRDIRVGTVKLFGPFDDVSTFHRFLRGGIRIEDAGTTFGDQVEEVHHRDYGIRFTYGDLASLNILMRDKNVVAIVDWQFARWYPEYWEYTKAHYNFVYQPEFHRLLDQKVT